ncbi:hypothetical protein J1N35_029013 [Gossypium stocksii]|uniref:Uncharacterized protein n=1 Tax=Gossypium stocksii TaxID=47602 RepID=A0A9D3ZRN3_9ROSI|nr:hypothetical protein J1N35_029013 [Gossypium stocksii]
MVEAQGYSIEVWSLRNGVTAEYRVFFFFFALCLTLIRIKSFSQTLGIEMGKRDVSDKVMARVPAEIERVVSAPKFNWQKVLAVQDFLHGCGKVTASDFGLNSQIAVDQSSQSKCSQALS